MHDPIAQTQIKLDVNNFDIEEEHEIDYGYQFHISGGAIINIYQNRKGKRSIVIQGKPNQKLTQLFKSE